MTTPHNNLFAREPQIDVESNLDAVPMTYCVAIRLNQGLIFLADTRTNAGVDYVSKVKKLFTWQIPGERVITIMTSGNLGITQAIISELNEDIERGLSNNGPTLLTADSMFEVAQIVGDKMRDAQQRYGPGLVARGIDSGANIIVGGQKLGGSPRLFLVYAAGNFIEAMDDSPFFQIGEHKYGKPIIDRVISVETDLEDAKICALLSMDSTLRSNLTVGMPLDLAVVRTDTFGFEQLRRIEADNPAFREFSERWSQELRESFSVMRGMHV